jgi:hypothetical protein
VRKLDRAAKDAAQRAQIADELRIRKERQIEQERRDKEWERAAPKWGQTVNRHYVPQWRLDQVFAESASRRRMRQNAHYELAKQIQADRKHAARQQRLAEQLQRQQSEAEAARVQRLEAEAAEAAVAAEAARRQQRLASRLRHDPFAGLDAAYTPITDLYAAEREHQKLAAAEAAHVFNPPPARLQWFINQRWTWVPIPEPGKWGAIGPLTFVHEADVCHMHGYVEVARQHGIVCLKQV